MTFYTKNIFSATTFIATNNVEVDIIGLNRAKKSLKINKYSI